MCQQSIVKHRCLFHLPIKVVTRCSFESHLSLLFLVQSQKRLSQLQLHVLIKFIPLSRSHLKHTHGIAIFTVFKIRQSCKISITSQRLIHTCHIFVIMTHGGCSISLSVIAVAQHPIHLGSMLAIRIISQEILRKSHCFVKFAVKESRLSHIKCYLFLKFRMILYPVESAQRIGVPSVFILNITVIKISSIVILSTVL